MFLARVGFPVHYYGQGDPKIGDSGPHAALLVHVGEDNASNLVFFDHNGGLHVRHQIPYYEPAMMERPTGSFWTLLDTKAPPRDHQDSHEDQVDTLPHASDLMKSAESGNHCGPGADARGVREHHGRSERDPGRGSSRA